MKSKSWNRCGELSLMSREVHQSSALGVRLVGGLNAKQLRGGKEIRPHSGTQRFGAWKASGLDQSDGMGTHLDINLKRL